MNIFLRPLAVVAALCAPFAALADYPERPVELIVPFAAGGGTDIMARIFAQALEKELGGPVVVVNRTGAGGEIGMAEVATSKPDGYRLAIINTPNVLTIPIERKAQFTPESFDLIGAIAEDPGTLSVLESSPIKTVEDLVRAARDTPGKMTYGTSGVGSAGHIAFLLLEQAADIEGRNIPFSGSSAVRTALLNGDIQVATANLGEAQTFGEGQPWRILGVMADARSSTAPELPTFAEAGFPIVAGSLRGVGGPKGIAPEVLNKLRAAMASAMKAPDFLEASAKANVPLRYLDAPAYEASLSAANDNMLKLWGEKPWKQ